MPRPSIHSQYRSKKPTSGIFLAGVAMATGGLGSGGKTAGAAGTTIGAGAITGSGGAAGGVCLATTFLAFRTACLGAGLATTAGFSAMTTGAGAGSGAATGADGFSATTSTGAGAATGTASGLVAQADKARAERSSATGTTTLSVLDMEFSRNTVADARSGRNLPTVSIAPQTIKCRSNGCSTNAVLHALAALPYNPAHAHPTFYRSHPRCRA